MHGCSVTLFSSWHATVCGVCLIMRKRLISCLRTFRSRNRRRRQACPATARTLRWHLFARQFVGGRLSTMYQLLSSCSSGNTPFIRHFDSFTKYKEFVQSLQYAENATVVKLVEKYDAQCPQLMAQLQSRLSRIEKKKLFGANHCAHE